MRVPLSWLREFVDLPDDVEEIRHALAMAGHEVESVERIEPGWEGVVVARVETVDAHPDADRIRVCSVTAGSAPLTVVCGAWNFEAGATVAFAPPGTVLPGDFEIGVRRIRGVESNGMICSEAELGIGDDAEGIVVMDGAHSPGMPLEEALGLPEIVFDLAITTNRGDAMSVMGVARDLAAWYGVESRRVDADPPTVEGDMGLRVEIQDPVGNPRFVARRVDGVEVKPSPLWMRMRLRAAGVRPISNLVDVTNYVMLELGQPLHVFDAATIAGDRLEVRRARPGEKLVTLDGVDRILDPDDLVICDADGPTSLSGTMGGEGSEVSKTTTSTIIEAASWDPPTIMYMSRRHGLRSEASARFERGVDPELPPLASARAAELILDLAGGRLVGEWIDEVARPHEPIRLSLGSEDVARVLGDGFDGERIATILGRLGFGVAGSDPFSVAVPSFRPDVTRPIDLVEEIARMADYDTFGERLRLGTGGGLTRDQRDVRRMREALAAIGFSQAITLPFVTPAELRGFRAPENHELGEVIAVKNPLSDEEALLRTSLLPGLLRALRHNRNRGRRAVNLFEIGRVFHDHPWPVDRRVPDQPERLGFAAAGSVGPGDLSGAGSEVDAHTATALIRYLAERLGREIDLQQGEAPGFHPTRTALVLVRGELAGQVGELHPLFAAEFGLEGRVAAGEVDLAMLLGARTDTVYRPVSPFPPADFDLSFELGREVSSERLRRVLQEAAGELCEEVRTFDEYRGGHLDEGRKALAFRIRLRAPDRTLQSEEIAGVRGRMVAAAEAFGAALRGSA